MALAAGAVADGPRGPRQPAVLTAITVERVLGRVGRDRLLDDLARELLVIEVLVARRVGLHLGLVDREHSDLRQAVARAEREHFPEQARQRLLVALDEPGTTTARDHTRQSAEPCPGSS